MTFSPFHLHPLSPNPTVSSPFGWVFLPVHYLVLNQQIMAAFFLRHWYDGYCYSEHIRHDLCMYGTSTNKGVGQTMKHLLRCFMSLTCHVSDTRNVLLKIRQSLGQQDTIKTHFSQIENWQCANKSSLSITLFFPRSLQEVAAYSQGSSQLGCLTSATTLVPWRTGWPCRTNILQCSTALWTCTR